MTRRTTLILLIIPATALLLASCSGLERPTAYYDARESLTLGCSLSTPEEAGLPLDVWQANVAWKSVGHLEDAHDDYKVTMVEVGTPYSNQFIGWGSAILRAESGVQKQWAYVNHPNDYNYPEVLNMTIEGCKEAFAEMARFDRLFD